MQTWPAGTKGHKLAPAVLVAIQSRATTVPWRVIGCTKVTRHLSAQQQNSVDTGIVSETIVKQKGCSTTGNLLLLVLTCSFGCYNWRTCSGSYCYCTRSSRCISRNTQPFCWGNSIASLGRNAKICITKKNVSEMTLECILAASLVYCT